MTEHGALAALISLPAFLLVLILIMLPFVPAPPSSPSSPIAAPSEPIQGLAVSIDDAASLAPLALSSKFSPCAPSPDAAIPIGSVSVRPVTWAPSSAWSEGAELLASRIADAACFYDEPASEALDELTRELSHLPPEMLELFIRGGWSLHVTSDPLESHLAERLSGDYDAGAIYGMTFFGADVREVWLTRDSISALPHEMGHVLDHELGNASSSALFRESLLNIEDRAGSGLRGAARMSEMLAARDGSNERFAALFSSFIRDEPSVLAASPVAWEALAGMFGSHLASYDGFSSIYAHARDEGTCRC